MTWKASILAALMAASALAGVAPAAGALEATTSVVKADVPEWHDLRPGDKVASGQPITNPDGSKGCHFDRVTVITAFYPEETAAFNEMDVAVTRTVTFEKSPENPCDLVVAEATQVVEPRYAAAAGSPLPLLPVGTMAGEETNPGDAPPQEEEMSAAATTCRNLEGVITYRPFYGGPDYLTETRNLIEYCYDGSSISMDRYSWWCKANEAHAFMLDGCTTTTIQWSGGDVWSAKKGDYHQFCCQFYHWTQEKPYARADGYAHCQHEWGGSTPRDQPELVCRYA